jgi:hypothetical protein
MESDSIRASAGNTLVDMWVNGKVRAVCVTREAIETYVGFDRAPTMSEDDRCEFVRAHLPLVVNAAKARLAESDPATDSITIGAGQLGTPPSGRVADRRKGERRNGDRRKADRAKEELPQGERRRSDRRKRDRRKSPNRSET